ncbi:MAG: efflux RND transporter periplasmic adaptor subunit, partial [Desulfobacteraceae bacterium]|nr:efflux RND transporter periplasmic adaptor subunit [Desulfobacteraceae bacterium]
FTVLGLLVLVALLGGIKGLQIRKMIAQGAQFVPPPETVTTAEAQNMEWESVLTAVGSLEAVHGIMVTAELSGKVAQINFESGAKVKAGDLLVQQDISSETAQLRAAEATVALTKLNYERAKQLLPEKVMSHADFDNAEAQFKQASAQADTIRAAIEKKTIRAPFTGRLGIRMINLGQVINAGQTIVSLQSLDPIYVNFQLPQQQLSEVSPGYTIRVTSDALPGQVVEGKITAINPEVDAATRNVRVQASLANPQEQLRPGMFANVTVVRPGKEQVLAIPGTAIMYAPYSNSVFVVEAKPAAQDGKAAGLALRQQFVELGERRGDFVVVRTGLKAGDTVVSTGVFKLRNGQSVVVNNDLSPKFKLAPEPKES